jgi:hypothetical protein
MWKPKAIGSIFDADHPKNGVRIPRRFTASGDYVEVGKGEDGTPILKLSHENVNRSRLRVDSRKWLLSKMLPRVYGEKVALTGEGGTPLIPENTSSRDLARSVLQLLREARIDDGAGASADDDPDAEFDGAPQRAQPSMDAAAECSSMAPAAASTEQPRKRRVYNPSTGRLDK